MQTKPWGDTISQQQSDKSEKLSQVLCQWEYQQGRTSIGHYGNAQWDGLYGEGSSISLPFVPAVILGTMKVTPHQDKRL